MARKRPVKELAPPRARRAGQRELEQSTKLTVWHEGREARQQVLKEQRAAAQEQKRQLAEAKQKRANGLQLSAAETTMLEQERLRVENQVKKVKRTPRKKRKSRSIWAMRG